MITSHSDQLSRQNYDYNSRSSWVWPDNLTGLRVG